MKPWPDLWSDANAEIRAKTASEYEVWRVSGRRAPGRVM